MQILPGLQMAFQVFCAALNDNCSALDQVFVCVTTLKTKAETKAKRVMSLFKL